MRQERVLAMKQTSARVRVSDGAGFMVPVPKRPCARCGGTTKAGGAKFASHKSGCRCVGCRLCRHCDGGSAAAPVAARRPAKNVDVTIAEDEDDG